MKRFIIFLPALFTFVGVLLNFAWLYHLLLPSEVIPPPPFPGAVRLYSMSPLSGSRTKNILVQMDGSHYWMADNILSASFHPVELVSRQASVQDTVTPKYRALIQVELLARGCNAFLIRYDVLYFVHTQQLIHFWPAVKLPLITNCLKTSKKTAYFALGCKTFHCILVRFTAFVDCPHVCKVAKTSVKNTSRLRVFSCMTSHQRLVELCLNRHFRRLCANKIKKNS